MIRLTIIGIVIVVLTLTGCVDDRQFQSLRSNCLSFSNEVAYLKARVKAVEEACLQLNTRLSEAEGRRTASDQSMSKPTMARTKQEQSSDPYGSRLSRKTFSTRLAGMTVSEVLTILGKPDKVNEDTGSQSWIYSAVRLATEDGGLEVRPALIVFEQGNVARAVLTENTQYSSEPTETGSSNAPAQAAAESSNTTVQTAAESTNTTIQLNQ